MKLLALDQSSQVSGYAIFEDDKLIHYGVISNDQPNIGVRLNYLRQEVIKLVEQYNIDEVIMEDIQLQANVATFKILAEVFGVLFELFTDLKIKHSAVLSTVWKSSLGIKGKDRAAQKRSAQEWVTNNYGIKPIQDICDAICIGCHYIRNKDSVFDWS